MASGSHHRHLRQRIYKNLEPYPHKDPVKRFLDKVIFVIGALGPLSTIPQIYLIYAQKNAAGVSATSWSIYFLFSIIWVTYGIIHKEKAIMFTYSIWFFMNGIVALGAMLY